MSPYGRARRSVEGCGVQTPLATGHRVEAFFARRASAHGRVPRGRLEPRRSVETGGGVIAGQAAHTFTRGTRARL